MQSNSCFKKITPFNGFDKNNPDNARQNNYAWSMAEFGDYIYVGTDRNQALAAIQGGILGPGTQPPAALVPQHVDMNAEIWRYKKDGTQEWERVFKAPEKFKIKGVRYLIPYVSQCGELALYAGCDSTLDRMFVLKSLDGVCWMILDTDITTGNSTRTMVVYEGTLYMGVVNDLNPSDITLLYATHDPQGEGWYLVTSGGEKSKNPRGMLYIMSVFNGYLYLGTAREGGFEVWRSEGTKPEPDHWKLVVDKGAGDALNELPMSMGVFKGCLYVGTGIGAAIISVGPERKYLPMKGFDMIRIDRRDNWQLVIGGVPVVPTYPCTGVRCEPVSGFPSGFGNVANAYCWQLQRYKNDLYLGTFDSSVMLPLLITSMLENRREALKYEPEFYVSSLMTQPAFSNMEENFGFDIWKSCDGVKWVPVTLDGFGNPYNYGARKLYVSDDCRLYAGTANPVQGCEVWVNRNCNEKCKRKYIYRISRG